MEENAECMLVIIGATPEGKKELIGFQVGLRESAQSWHELLTDIKGRGLSVPPQIAVGDGAMGFWNALDRAFPGAKHQRCWGEGRLGIAPVEQFSPERAEPRTLRSRISRTVFPRKWPRP